ncbi:V-type ATP synthase subunit I [Clostridium culturomicium]|uniref:V-type ATP synthase subunit I n=1 Tax=Clostridium culturomicium TaxID=1499683 RepID=UPI000590D861|nr:V-type ATP synthase subunit I [Clostridium culturomicium]
MAIVKMNKFTLLAFEENKKVLLEKFQSFENVQFVDAFNEEESEQLSKLIKDNSSNEAQKIEEDLSKVKFIIETLTPFAKKDNMIKGLKEGRKSYTFKELSEIKKNSDWQELYQELKKKDSEINSNKNHISKFKSSIEELTPWTKLDVPVSSFKKLSSTKAFLGMVPQGLVESLSLELNEKYDNCYFENLGTKGKDIYIIVITPNEHISEIEKTLKSFNYSKVEIHCEGIPLDVIREYEEKIKTISENNKKIELEMKQFVDKLEDIKAVYEVYSSELLRINSTDRFLRSENIVAMEGYYPTETQNEFERILKEALGENYYLETKAADGDDVPVQLKNNSVVEAFESITTMYSVPKYKEIDPTPLFAPFYILFFGMMLSDAGYGAIMVIGTAIALKFFNLEDDMRKSIKMFLYLGISTVFWGVMYGSYFGDFLEKFIPKLKPLWMKPDKDVALLMIVAVALGLIQIFIGLGIKAYMQIRDKDYFGAFSDVFLWYVTLIGLMLWGGSAFGLALPAVVVTVAKYAAILSMVGIVLTNGRHEASWGARLGQGFYSLYGITSYVGDLVSYTRLAALGLATGFISYAFNIMVNMVSTNIFTTILFGVLIFLVGHVFNLFINALGAYVHTCRLQYLEYFGKFYEGGGNAFEPLKYNSKYFKVVNKR